MNNREQTMKFCEPQPNEGKAIVLNRMYVGDYLSTNLGHEVINMFQADNGRHYLYLNAYGNFGKDHSGQIGYMLLVKYHSEGLLEVIGKAEGLTDVVGANATLSQDYKSVNSNISKVQNDYIEAENITYSGVPLRKIFNDAEQQNIFITYKAARLYKPKREIFIGYGVDADVVLTGYKQAKTSLKTYIYPEGTFTGDSKKEDIEAKRTDYIKLLELIEQKELWEESIERINDDLLKIKSREVSIFDICQIQNNENAFSCALAHFMKQPKYAELWKEFFSKELNIELDKLDVNREECVSKSESQKGRIDLVIRDSKNIVVIENKILSDINKVATDQNNSTQLRRYYDYVQFLIKEETVNKKGEKEKGPDYGKTAHFFILCPEYNQPTIEEEKDKEGNLLTPQMSDIYTQFTYAKVYNFLKDRIFSFYNDGNFVAFFEAMERHTYNNVNDYLYHDMLEKFVRRIKEANNSK